MENPGLSKLDELSREYSGEVASYSGIAMKELFLLVIVAASLGATWYFGYATTITTMVTGIMGLIACIAITAKPAWAGTLSPLYAILEGMFLACITVVSEAYYPGIVLDAVLMTMGIAFAAAFVYSRGIIKVDSRFMSAVSVMMVGLLFCYLGRLVLEFFFGVSFSFLDHGIIGVIVSVAILLLATACLFMDYEQIRATVQGGLSKEYEWFCAFSLLVTIIWVYIRVLDLLRILRGDD